MDYKHQAIKTNQNPFNKLNKDTQTIFEHHIFQNSTKTQNPREQGLETWYILRKIENSYLFLEDWWRDDEENRGFVSEHGEFRRGRQWTVTIYEGKLKSFWKMPWK